MRPATSVSPDWYRLGVSPKWAPTALEDRNRPGSSTAVLKVIDTNDPVPDLRDRPEARAGDAVTVQGYAMLVLKRIQ